MRPQPAAAHAPNGRVMLWGLSVMEQRYHAVIEVVSGAA
jgi:hypothetical protein